MGTMADQPKRRWFRFKLSTVLILTAIAAWGMACRPWWIHRVDSGLASHFVDIPKGATVLRKVPLQGGSMMSGPHIFYKWELNEYQVNRQLRWPVLVLVTMIGWKVASAAVRSNPPLRLALVSSRAWRRACLGGIVVASIAAIVMESPGVSSMRVDQITFGTYCVAMIVATGGATAWAVLEMRERMWDGREAETSLVPLQALVGPDSDRDRGVGDGPGLVDSKGPVSATRSMDLDQRIGGR